MREPVPMRERSIEIFGDEKQLEALLATSLFAPGRLTLDALHSFRLPIPLAIRHIGPSSTVLVVENSDTFHSLHSVLQSIPTDIGHLAYGAGSAFESAVADLQHLEKVDQIRYFGDLDGNGLAIPARAAVTAQELGLPPVEPATPLYEALLARTPGAGSPVEAGRAADLTTWLHPRQRELSQRLLQRGERIAQEALNRRHLRQLFNGPAWQEPTAEGPDCQREIQ
jgi:hypothetical protein